MKTERNNIEVLDQFTQLLISKVKADINKIQEGMFNGTYLPVERQTIANTFALMNELRQMIFSQFGYLYGEEMSGGDLARVRAAYKSFNNRLNEIDDLLVAVNTNLFRDNPIQMDDIETEADTKKYAKNKEYNRNLQNMMIDTVMGNVNSINFTPEDKKAWIDELKKSRYNQRSESFQKKLAEDENELKRETEGRGIVDETLSEIVLSSDGPRIKFEKITDYLDQIGSLSQGKSFTKAFFLQNEKGKDLINTLLTQKGNLQSIMMAFKAASIKEKIGPVFAEILKKYHKLISEAVVAEIEWNVTRTKFSSDTEQVLFQRLSSTFSMLASIPNNLLNKEQIAKIQVKIEEAFNIAIKENVSTTNQIKFLAMYAKYAEQFKGSVDVTQVINKIVNIKVQDFLDKLNSDLALLDNNKELDRYSILSRKMNIIQRAKDELKSFSILPAAGEYNFNERLPVLSHFIDEQHNSLINQIVPMLTFDNSRDNYPLYNKIWNMNEIMRTLYGPIPEQIEKFKQQMKHNITEDMVVTELNNILNRDKKELNTNEKIARFNMVLDFMGMQDNPNCQAIKVKLLANMVSGIERTEEKKDMPALIKLSRLDKMYKAARNLGLENTSDGKASLDRLKQAEDTYVQNAANNLISLSRNAFKSFSFYEFLNSTDKNPYKPDLEKYTQNLAAFIRNDVTSQSDVNIRTRHLSRWLQIADMCAKQGDFASAVCIFTTLSQGKYQIAKSQLSREQQELLAVSKVWTNANNLGFTAMMDKYQSENKNAIMVPDLYNFTMSAGKMGGQDLTQNNVATTLFRPLYGMMQRVQNEPPLNTQMRNENNLIMTSQMDLYVYEKLIDKNEKSNMKDYASALKAEQELIQNTQIVNETQSKKLKQELKVEKGIESQEGPVYNSQAMLKLFELQMRGFIEEAKFGSSLKIFRSDLVYKEVPSSKDSVYEKLSHIYITLNENIKKILEKQPTEFNDKNLRMDHIRLQFYLLHNKFNELLHEYGNDPVISKDLFHDQMLFQEIQQRLENEVRRYPGNDAENVRLNKDVYIAKPLSQLETEGLKIQTNVDSGEKENKGKERLTQSLGPTTSEDVQNRSLTQTFMSFFIKPKAPTSESKTMLALSGGDKTNATDTLKAAVEHNKERKELPVVFQTEPIQRKQDIKEKQPTNFIYEFNQKMGSHERLGHIIREFLTANNNLKDHNEYNLTLYGRNSNEQDPRSSLKISFVRIDENNFEVKVNGIKENGYDKNNLMTNDLLLSIKAELKKNNISIKVTNISMQEMKAFESKDDKSTVIRREFHDIGQRFNLPSQRQPKIHLQVVTGHVSPPKPVGQEPAKKPTL